MASVYAQALFDAAQDADAVGAGAAASWATSSPPSRPPRTLRGVLADPQIETDGQGRASSPSSRARRSRWSPTRCSCCWQRGRFAILEELRAEYDALAAAEAAVVNVEVTSAVELTPATHKKIAARVEEVTGRRVELAQRVDPAIVGGLVLRVGDVIVDGSVRSRIRQLRRRLATAEVRGDVE